MLKGKAFHSKEGFSLWGDSCSAQKNQLEQLAQDLLALAHQSEQEFLNLGEKLQKISAASRHISQQTKLALGKLSGDGDDQVLITMKKLFQKTTGILHSQSEFISCSFGQMKPISEKLYHLSQMREHFHRISRFLRILGIAIKIESNRAGEMGQEFMVLAEEIDQLWTRISKNTDELFYQAEQTAKMADSAKHTLTENWHQHLSLVSHTRQSIQKAVEGVGKMFQLSGETMGKIGLCSQEISKEIGQVVFSLQTHDIIRQQIEHIHQALGEVRMHWSSKTAPDGRSHLYEAQSIMLVQIKQLESAIHEVKIAGEQIRKSLLAIAQKSEKENEEISSFYGHTCNQETGQMENLRQEITKLVTILHQCEQLGEHISEILSPATQSAEQITEYMIKMDKVGYSINLLSLNALVKAAKNQESGQTFDVLAEEIHQQANLSSKLSKETQSQLSSLTETNQALNKTLGLIQEQNDKAGPIITQALQHTAKLGELNQEMAETIQNLTKNNSQLAIEILEEAKKINFDQKFQAQAEDSLRQLKQLYTQLTSRLSTDTQTTEEQQKAYIESLSGSYTMEKERKIHLEAINGLQDKPQTDHQEEKTEAVQSSESSTQASPSNEDDLGDNVELF